MNNSINVSIAEKLTELRAAKGLTQDEVAAELSISGKTLSKWETGASEPGLSMLAKLSEFYDISADALLGIAPHEERSTPAAIHSAFEGLDRRAAALTAFDLVSSIIPASYDIFASYPDDINDNAEVLPQKPESGRSCISTHEFYNFVVSSDDVNIAVMLLGNKSGFKWLSDGDGPEKIARLFAILSDTDALRLCSFIHSNDCPESFTADYIERRTGLPGDRVLQILYSFCEIELCYRQTAHLASGVTDIFESFGNGNVLSLITLAYEHMCGRRFYSYNFNGRCKMTGGE